MEGAGEGEKSWKRAKGNSWKERGVLVGVWKMNGGWLRCGEEDIGNVAVLAESWLAMGG
jgi:hypothetical protein